jgi:peptide-methionine (S)-S-oxide reductase
MQTESIVLGGGCFWCLEAAYQRLAGVQSVVSGYAGGTTEDPTYREVSGGTTGHAEVVRVEFDPSVITLADLFDVFWAIHDPTTPDRQGNDVGPEYRSIILYADQAQHEEAAAAIKRAQALWDDPVVTELRPLAVFYPAEAEHQDYYNQNRDRNPYCAVVINPKLTTLRQKFAARLRPEA